MNSDFEVGGTYLFFAMPLWFRGQVESEIIRFVVVSAETAEYLADAPDMAAYISGRVRGEKLKKELRVHKDSLTAAIKLS